MATQTNYQKCVAALSSIKIKYPQLLDEFIKWYKDGMWDDDALTDEFTDDILDCSFIDDLKENNKIKDTQALEIWQILNNATLIKVIDDNKQNDSIIVNLFSINIKEKDKKKHVYSKSSPTRKRIKKQAPIILIEDKLSNIADILYIEYIGYRNDNYPLLIHFVDAYTRYQLNQWILNGKKYPPRITTSNFFSKHCNNTHFKETFSRKDRKYIIDLIQTAIKSYQNRVLTPFQCIEPAYKFNDKNGLAFANYLFEMARIVRRVSDIPIYNLTSMLPLQIDFLILNKDIVFNTPNSFKCQGIKQLFADSENDTDDDDDDDIYDKNESKTVESENGIDQIPDNLDMFFQKKKIKYFSYDSISRWSNSIEHMKKLNKNERCERNVFILDRRKKHLNQDRLYLFKPHSKEYNKFEKNTQELVHASLHFNSVKSMLPRDGKKRTDDFGVRDGLRGMMFVMSYHILAKDEIRCYLFHQSQCFRFFGQDLINVIPTFFTNDKKVTKTYLDKYNYKKNNKQLEWRKSFDEFCSTFKDYRFGLFYYGLIGEKSQIDIIQKKITKLN
eukprot:112490_1